MEALSRFCLELSGTQHRPGCKHREETLWHQGFGLDFTGEQSRSRNQKSFCLVKCNPLWSVLRRKLEFIWNGEAQSLWEKECLILLLPFRPLTFRLYSPVGFDVGGFFSPISLTNDKALAYSLGCYLAALLPGFFLLKFEASRKPPRSFLESSVHWLSLQPLLPPFLVLPPRAPHPIPPLRGYSPLPDLLIPWGLKSLKD